MSLPVSALQRMYDNAVQLMRNQEYDQAAEYVADGLANAQNKLDAGGRPFAQKFQDLQAQLEAARQGAGPVLPAWLVNPATPASTAQPEPPQEDPDVQVERLLHAAHQAASLAEREALLEQAQAVVGVNPASVSQVMALLEKTRRDRQAEALADRVQRYEAAAAAGNWEQALAEATAAQALDGTWATEKVRHAQAQLELGRTLPERWQAHVTGADTPNLAALEAVVREAQITLEQARRFEHPEVPAWAATLTAWEERLAQGKARIEQLTQVAMDSSAQPEDRDKALAELARDAPDVAASLTTSRDRLEQALNQSQQVRRLTSADIRNDPYAAMQQVREALSSLQAVPVTVAVQQAIEALNALTGQIREAITEKSKRQTLGETRSEHNTPAELQAANAPLLSDVDKLDKGTAGDKALAAQYEALRVSNEEAFKRAALAKLRAYVATQALAAQNTPPFKFEVALKAYVEAERQWGSFQRAYLPEDDHLRARLKLVAAQREDLSAAQYVGNTVRSAWQDLQDLAHPADKVLKTVAQAQEAVRDLKPGQQHAVRVLVGHFHLAWHDRVHRQVQQHLEAYQQSRVAMVTARASGEGVNALSHAQTAERHVQAIGKLHADWQAWRNALWEMYAHALVDDRPWHERFVTPEWRIPDMQAEAKQQVQAMQSEAKAESRYAEAVNYVRAARLTDAETALHDIPENTYYAGKAAFMLRKIPEVKNRWEQSQQAEREHRYDEALAQCEAILREMPEEADFARQRLHDLRPRQEAWKTRETWLNAAHRVLDLGQFELALAHLSRVSPEFAQDKDVVDARLQAEGGEEEKKRIESLESNLRAAWQGDLAQADYEAIGQWLSQLPETRPSRRPWWERWERAHKVFEQVNNRLGDDADLLKQLDNLPPGDRDSTYAQKLRTDLENRQAQRQSDNQMRAKLEQARANADWGLALRLSATVMKEPKFRALRATAQSIQDQAAEALRMDVRTTLNAEPAERATNLPVARRNYQALLDVLGQTVPGLAELGRRLAQAEKIAESHRLLAEAEDNSTRVLELVKEMRVATTADYAYDVEQLAARAEVRRFANQALAEKLLGHSLAAAEALDKAEAAYKKITYPDEVEKELMGRLAKDKTVIRREAARASARVAMAQGDFDRAKAVLAGKDDLDEEIKVATILERLVTTARQETALLPALDKWRNVLVQFPGLTVEPAHKEHRRLLAQALAEAQTLAQTVTGAALGDFSPAELETLRRVRELVAKIGDHEPTPEQAEATRRVEEQIKDKLTTWKNHLTERMQAGLGMDGVNWPAADFQALADQVRWAVEAGLLPEREKRNAEALADNARYVASIAKNLHEAEAAYNRTLSAGTGDFTEAALKVDAALVVGFFSSRRESVTWFKKINDAKDDVAKLRAARKRYDQARNSLQAALDPEVTDDKTLKKAYAEAQANLEAALEANADIRVFDRENRYRLPERGWPAHQATDPLLAEHAALTEQQTDLRKVHTSYDQLTIIRKSAEDVSRRADEADAKRSSLDELQASAKLWQQVAEILARQHQQEQVVLDCAGLTPAARLYQERVKQGQRKDNETAQARASRAQANADDKQQLHDKVAEYLKQAIDYEANNPEAAVREYDAIFAMAPIMLADQRRKALKKELSDRNRQRRNIGLMIGGVILVVMLVVLGGWLACAGGQCERVFSALDTPTPTRPVITRVFTPTPTLAPTFTITPSPTRTLTPAPTVTPSATPTRSPLICQVDVDRVFWRQNPGENQEASGLFSVRGDRIAVVDVARVGNVDYWQVAPAGNLDQPLGWINRRVTSLICP